MSKLWAQHLVFGFLLSAAAGPVLASSFIVPENATHSRYLLEDINWQVCPFRKQVVWRSSLNNQATVCHRLLLNESTDQLLRMDWYSAAKYCERIRGEFIRPLNRIDQQELATIFKDQMAEVWSPLKLALVDATSKAEHKPEGGYQEDMNKCYSVSMTRDLAWNLVDCSLKLPVVCSAQLGKSYKSYNPLNVSGYTGPKWYNSSMERLPWVLGSTAAGISFVILFLIICLVCCGGNEDSKFLWCGPNARKRRLTATGSAQFQRDIWTISQRFRDNIQLGNRCKTLPPRTFAASPNLRDINRHYEEKLNQSSNLSSPYVTFSGSNTNTVIGNNYNTSHSMTPSTKRAVLYLNLKTI